MSPALTLLLCGGVAVLAGVVGWICGALQFEKIGHYEMQRAREELSVERWRTHETHAYLDGVERERDRLQAETEDRQAMFDAWRDLALFQISSVYGDQDWSLPEPEPIKAVEELARRFVDSWNFEAEDVAALRENWQSAHPNDVDDTYWNNELHRRRIRGVGIVHVEIARRIGVLDPRAVRHVLDCIGWDAERPLSARETLQLRRLVDGEELSEKRAEIQARVYEPERTVGALKPSTSRVAAPNREPNKHMKAMLAAFQQHEHVAVAMKYDFKGPA